MNPADPLADNRTNSTAVVKELSLLREIGHGAGIVFLTGLVLVISHWPTLCHLADRWWHEPQYSHGFLVPLFALGVLWSRRDRINRLEWSPAWEGGALLLAGVGLRLYAVRGDHEPLETFALLPTLFGTVLLVGGRSILNWSWPALAFLAFMLPLPYFLEVGLAIPLRRMATLASSYVLQTLGCPAMASGNTIWIEETPLNVEEACSGLGMLMTFFALSTAVAMITTAPIWDRFVLVFSAIPVAIVANVMRISATGLACYYAGKESSLAHVIYHDLAGWLMMPIALALLWAEMKYLSHIFVEESRAPLPLLRAK